MKKRTFIPLVLASILVVFSLPLRAQLVTDGATKIIDGTNINTTSLIIGTNGAFTTVIVTNAGSITNVNNSIIGNNSTAVSNQVTVVGTNSIWSNTGNLSVGSSGKFNLLLISNGGKVVNSFGNLGLNTGGDTNVAIVTGPGSLWFCTGDVNVGSLGSGCQLFITNGGFVRDQTGRMGNNSSNNFAVVAGAGSVWSNTIWAQIGDTSSFNQLWVTNGGNLVCSSGFIAADFQTNGSGNANIVVLSDPSSKWTCSSDLFIGNIGISNQLIISNGASVFAHDLFLGFFSSSSNNTITLGGGNLTVTNLIIASNSLLSGNGTIKGSVTNQGILSPGASIGQLAILGNLRLASGSSNFFELNKSSATNDNIIGLTNVTYGGTLVVSNLSGSLTNGDTFKLFKALTYSGAFSSIVLPPLAPGLFWRTNLLLDGSIQVFNRDPGVDVSHFQGENGIAQANWNQMYSEGRRFTFVKATEATSVLDATMSANMNRAVAAGLRAGVYHFAHPDTHPSTNEAVQEADFFLSYAGNFIGPGYLRPVLDLEVSGGLSKSNLTAWVIAFSNEIIANRGPSAAPIVYTLTSFATSGLDARLTNYDLWIAATGTGLNPNTDSPPNTGVFGNWSFWQYSVATAGGISPIDLDICHSEFKSLDSFLITAVSNPIAPTIVTQPQSRTIRVGNSAAFLVGVSVTSSTPLYYQWRFNGTNIVAATNSAYTQTNCQLSSAGGYTVVISNASTLSVTSAVAVLTVLNPPPPVPGTVLYSENFDSYSSPSIVTNDGITNGFQIFYSSTAAGFDFSARFGYNYSTVSSPTTIPSAPHSTNATTKGLYLTVNKDAVSGVAAVNLYPISQNFTGTFALKFDMWINFPNTGTATEDALFGINHSGTVTNRIGQAGSDGLFFAVDGDGGVSAGSGTLRDFAVFRGGGPGLIPGLLSNTASFGPAPLLGSQFDNTDPGFAALFPSKTLSFTTAPGAPGNGWVSVEVRQTTNTITWFLNDTLVAQYTNTFGYNNGNILVGYDDNFQTAGTSDNFAIFDNIRVETVPDIDGNGIADAWEIQYFGQYGIDPDADGDGDGMSNLREYYAGTNPTNAASTFHMLSAGRANNDVRIDWTAVGGHSYVVQIATNNLAGGITNFLDLSPVITVPGSNETTTNYVHVGAATNRSSYYRIRLGP